MGRTTPAARTAANAAPAAACLATTIPIAIALVLALTLGACATPKPPPPKPPSESDYRERFTADRTRAALASVPELPLREALDRHVAERGREARSGGRRLTVDRIAVGERIGIGGGMELVRVFVLYHEFDARSFTTWLEGVELVAGRIRAAFRQPVGGSGKELAVLAGVVLNRAFLEIYRHREGDPLCCPTERGEIAYSMTGFALEPLR